MGLSRQELFGKLLEQIHFPEKDNSAFRNAAVQSVVVHKKSRQWEFHLIFNKALVSKESSLINPSSNNFSSNAIAAVEFSFLFSLFM